MELKERDFVTSEEPDNTLNHYDWKQNIRTSGEEGIESEGSEWFEGSNQEV